MPEQEVKEPTAPLVAPDTMQRLSYIRYIYSIGVSQSRQAEPLATVAVLSWHDSVELFLHLAAEVKNIELKPNDNLKFNDYFGRINERLQSRRLQHHPAMRRLNDTRNALKHRGQLPARSAVEQLRADVTRFFEDNTSLIFGIEFDSISLAELVVYPLSRQSLREAQAALNEGNTEGAGVAIGRAFAQLLVEHEREMVRRLGRSPFRFVSPFLTPPSFRQRPIHDSGQVNFEEDIVKSLESVQDALEIMAMGVDYRRYAKFRYYMPAVRHVPRSDKFVVQIMSGILGKPKWPPSMEICRWCFDFVVETAIQLQEIDEHLEQERT